MYHNNTWRDELNTDFLFEMMRENRQRLVERDLKELNDWVHLYGINGIKLNKDFHSAFYQMLIESNLARITTI